MQLKSNKHLIVRDAVGVYAFINDFRNLETVLPEQVRNFKADADSCSFEVSGIGEIALLINERVENRKVSAVSTGKSPLEFKLSVELHPEDENSTSVVICVNAELSPMLEMIAKNPLNNFINIMSEKLKNAMGH